MSTFVPDLVIQDNTGKPIAQEGIVLLEEGL